MEKVPPQPVEESEKIGTLFIVTLLLHNSPQISWLSSLPSEHSGSPSHAHKDGMHFGDPVVQLNEVESHVCSPGGSKSLGAVIALLYLNVLRQS